ncbi:hypothetical protein [Sphingobium sp. EM0848]|uniref:hypothetical protein n=1 Tax=Sphingobium sp. EM0848 TaxID=2743473 RepID=UPI00159BF980|nr:hypothetical protein [Sphingobium sp. EM0848]
MTLITLLLQNSTSRACITAAFRPTTVRVMAFSAVRTLSIYLRKISGMALRVRAMDILPVQLNLSDT